MKYRFRKVWCETCRTLQFQGECPHAQVTRIVAPSVEVQTALRSQDVRALPAAYVGGAVKLSSKRSSCAPGCTAEANWGPCPCGGGGADHCRLCGYPFVARPLTLPPVVSTRIVPKTEYESWGDTDTFARRAAKANKERNVRGRRK